MFTVLLTSKLDNKITMHQMEFETESQVRRFVREELLWESCVRIVCHALEINERGSFA